MTAQAGARPALTVREMDGLLGPAVAARPMGTFRVAGMSLVTGLDLGALAPFRTNETDDWPAGPPPDGDRSRTVRDVVYRGTGWVGGRLRRVECTRGRSESFLEIEDIGLVSVDHNGESIHVRELAPGCGPDDLSGAVLGPALVLALARKGTWCLHASAVEAHGRAVLFLGRSGAGKSTLARRLGAEGGAGRRLADDVVPVALSGGELRCLPHFPQLKLGAGEQVSLDVPERIRVEAVYSLEAPANDGRRPAIRVEELSPRDTVGTLVRGTVAARLFDASMLQRHLAFCAGVAAAVPVRWVVYPLRPESVAEMRELLVEDGSRQ